MWGLSIIFHGISGLGHYRDFLIYHGFYMVFETNGAWQESSTILSWFPQFNIDISSR